MNYRNGGNNTANGCDSDMAEEKIKWYGTAVLTLATQANNDAMHKATLLVERDVKRSFPKVGTGRIYRRDVRSKTKKTKIHIASAPGQPPAIDTGHLRSSIQSKVQVRGINVLGEVGSDMPYSLYLELGTRTMEKRPYLMPTVRKDKRKIGEIFKRANS